MKPRGICLVCNEYPPAPHGGIGTFTRTLAKELTRHAWRVRVVGLYPSQDGIRREHDDGVKVVRLPFPDRDVLSIRALRSLYGTVRDWALAGKIDLVEVPDAEGWAAFWGRLPVPVVARVHGSASYFSQELGRSMNRFTYCSERLSMRRADFWCSVSEYAAEKTQQLFGLQPVDAISYVPVAVPAIPGKAARSSNRAVFTGTLTLKKGIVPLFRAWSAVFARVPSAELHIYGKDLGRNGRRMQDYLLEFLNVSARSQVHFHGHCESQEIIGALSTARAAVFPSYAEAFAFAPVEAMACGCPTIYSSRTSGRELMRTGQEGILIDPDDPSGIADAIVSLLQNDQLAAQLGEYGRNYVSERFTLSVIVPQIEKFYEDCIGRFAREAVRRSSRHAAVVTG